MTSLAINRRDLATRPLQFASHRWLGSAPNQVQIYTNTDVRYVPPTSSDVSHSRLVALSDLQCLLKSIVTVLLDLDRDLRKTGQVAAS